MKFKLLLEFICGICWTIVYILIIIKGFKYKTYGMPFIAIFLNIAWEFTFTIIYKPINYPLAKFIFIPWFLLDIIILYTFIKYGYKDFNKKYKINKPSFYLFSIISIILSTVTMYLFAKDLSPLYNNDILQASGFIANCQNFIMSVLFVYMILDRKNLKGQSIFIALFKWIGTLCIGILKFKGLLPYIPTELFIILLIQVFDIAYILILYKFKKHPNIIL